MEGFCPLLTFLLLAVVAEEKGGGNGGFFLCRTRFLCTNLILSGISHFLSVSIRESSVEELGETKSRVSYKMKVKSQFQEVFESLIYLFV